MRSKEWLAYFLSPLGSDRHLSPRPHPPPRPPAALRALAALAAVSAAAAACAAAIASSPADGMQGEGMECKVTE